MNEYLFFQSHKKDLGKQEEAFITDAFQQKNEGQDHVLKKYDQILKKLDKEYEEKKQQQIEGQFLSEKKKKKQRRRSVADKSLLEPKTVFTEFSMRGGLNTISNQYKD